MMLKGKPKETVTATVQPVVLVVGYYGHCNLGDEQYKTTIQYVLKQVFDHDQDKDQDFSNDFIDFID